MRMITTALPALGFVAAMTLAAPTPSLAQGIYLEGPGVEFGIGPRYHRYYRHDYGYDRPYVYGARPYYEHRYYRGWNRDWD